MKSVFNTLFSVLAGACAALLVLKFVNPPVEEEQPDYQTKMRSYAPPSENVPATAWPDFTAPIERAMPAVVCISNQRIVSSRRGWGRNAQYYEVPAGQGSGFFIREDGYILTNYHVASGANALLVTDNEGREYHADLVGADPTSDLAVLKVEPPKGKKFPALAFRKVVTMPERDVVDPLDGRREFDLPEGITILERLPRETDHAVREIEL